MQDWRSLSASDSDFWWIFFRESKVFLQNADFIRLNGSFSEGFWFIFWKKGGVRGAREKDCSKEKLKR
jgi:hypothetical protein